MHIQRANRAVLYQYLQWSHLGKISSLYVWKSGLLQWSLNNSVIIAFSGIHGVSSVWMDGVFKGVYP